METAQAYSKGAAIIAREAWTTVLHQVERLCAEGTSTGSGDRELLARFAAARAESALSFEAIVRGHGPMVLETCRRMLGGDRHAAEDAFQATFLVLARRAGALSVPPGGSLGAWLHRVACHTARNARRASSRRTARERRVAEGSSTIRETDTSSSINDEGYGILHEEVARVPERYRAAVVLCYFEGLTHDQAAATLRWPVGTVRGYLARARNRLRGRLIRRGVAPAAEASLLTHQLTSATTILAPALVDSITSSLARGTVTTTIARLAEAMTRTWVAEKVSRVALGLLIALLGIGGVGLTAAHLQADERAGRPDSGSVPAAQPAPERPVSGRVDVHGDPLPDGAVARIGTTRLNHGAMVNAVAYSPDGSPLASLGWDQAIRLWDPTNGRELRRLGDPTDSLVRMAFSPDGRILAAGSSGREPRIVLLEVASGRELRRTGPLKGGIWAIAFSPDGRFLATGDARTPDIVLRDVSTLEETRRIQALHEGVRSIAFTPDGGSLFAMGDENPPRDGDRREGVAALFEIGTGRELRRFNVSNARVDAAALSRDGRHVAMGGTGGFLTVLDSSTGEAILRLQTDQPIKCLRFSPDGKVLAAGATEGGEVESRPARAPAKAAAIRGARHDVNGFGFYAVTLWDVATGRELRRIPAHLQCVQDVAYSPDGRTLASCGVGNVIRLWDVASGRERLGSDEHHSAIRSMAISPDARRVTTGGYDGTIREWDPTTGGQLRIVGRCTHAVQDLAYTPDGRGLVTGSYDGTCRLWDLATGKDLRHFDVINGLVSYVEVSPDGRRLCAGLKTFDLGSGRQLATMLDRDGKEYPNPNYQQTVFTCDSAGVLACTSNEGVVLFDAKSGRRLGVVAKPPQRFFALAISHDGRLLATGGEISGGGGDPRDYSIRLWELASAREVARLGGDADGHIGGPTGPTTALAFSHDGRWLVSGGALARGGRREGDLALRIWDLAALVPRYRLLGHRDTITDVVFSRDDRRLVSSSEDATALVWDMAKLARTSRTVSSTPIDPESAWGELGGNDAARAYRTIWAMAADPDRALPLLDARLKPVAADDPRPENSIAPIADGETLRRLRAIAVAEKIGTPAARRVLERLASGFAGARKTSDAKGALLRLDGRQLESTSPGR